MVSKPHTITESLSSTIRISKRKKGKQLDTDQQRDDLTGEINSSILNQDLQRRPGSPTLRSTASHRKLFDHQASLANYNTNYNDITMNKKANEKHEMDSFHKKTRHYMTNVCQLTQKVNQSTTTLNNDLVAQTSSQILTDKNQQKANICNLSV